MKNLLPAFRRAQHEEGFTLIELMVTVLIIGTLSSISVPVYVHAQDEALKTSIRADVRNTTSQAYQFLATSPQADFDNLTYDIRSGIFVNSAPGYTAENPAEDYSISVRGDWERFTVTGWTEKANDYTFHYDSLDGKFKDGNTPLPPPA